MEAGDWNFSRGERHTHDNHRTKNRLLVIGRARVGAGPAGSGDGRGAGGDERQYVGAGGRSWLVECG
jgi:hypothetical protein